MGPGLNLHGMGPGCDFSIWTARTSLVYSFLYGMGPGSSRMGRDIPGPPRIPVGNGVPFISPKNCPVYLRCDCHCHYPRHRDLDLPLSKIKGGFSSSSSDGNST